MVLFSTPKSIKDEEVSTLAVVETFLAVAASLSIYFFYDMLAHIVVSSAIAPFLLLRTERSTAQALALADRSSSKFESLAHHLVPEIKVPHPFWGWMFFSYSLAVVLVLWVANITVIFLIKFAVVAFNLATNTLDSISSVPDNWRRTVLYTDLFAYPEIVPGIEDYEGRGSSIRDLRTSQALQFIYSESFLPVELRRQRFKSQDPTTSVFEPKINTLPKAAESILNFLEHIDGALHLLAGACVSLLLEVHFLALEPLVLGV